MKPSLINAKDAASILGVSTATFNRLKKSGDIVAFTRADTRGAPCLYRESEIKGLAQKRAK